MEAICRAALLWADRSVVSLFVRQTVGRTLKRVLVHLLCRRKWSTGCRGSLKDF